MIITEFNIPTFIVPKSIYRIPELDIIYLPTSEPYIKTDYWNPSILTKLIITNRDNSFIKKVVRDFISFSNFLNMNHSQNVWFNDVSLIKTDKYEKIVKKPDDYIEELFSEPNWTHSVDYDKYPLHEASDEPSTINFKKEFIRYVELDKLGKDAIKIKNLIDYFSYIQSSFSVFNKTYDNINLKVSNYFTLVEALINIDIKNQSGFIECPNCGEKMPRKKKMTELIKEFVANKITDKEIEEIVSSILVKHYKLRNLFSHEAKFDTLDDNTEKLLKKIGRHTVFLEDDIKHTNGTLLGLMPIQAFLRIDLLEKMNSFFNK